MIVGMESTVFSCLKNCTNERKTLLVEDTAGSRKSKPDFAEWEPQEKDALFSANRCAVLGEMCPRFTSAQPLPFSSHL